MGERWKWFDDKRWVATLLKMGWVVVLLCAAVLLELGNHIGPAVSLLAIASSTFFFQIIEKPCPIFVHVLYWGTNLAVARLFVGFISGCSWQLHRYLPNVFSLMFPCVSSMYILSESAPRACNFFRQQRNLNLRLYPEANEASSMGAH